MNTSTALLIKETALEHFALKGFESTCLMEIAKDIGLPMSTFETYYDNKEEIFLSVFEFFAKFYTNSLGDLILATKDFALEERVCAITLGVTNNACNNRMASLFWKRIIFFPPEAIKIDLLERLEELIQNILQALKSIFIDAFEKQEMKNDNHSLLAASLYNIINGLTVRLYMNGSDFYETEARFLCKAFCNEIKT
ncbi:TetR/AcrR family transcriptional regulator [Peribacillus deserti]|uniref:HTH tetR-type domain-containing protein n=1 Tax=Peribacillus deserti TaxID=673318 RepID=A0A2N5M0V7_9BACI|nr:TetR/AcrR family transcriptional regulator [Peribacillus deserti]PLT27997.1 hypothetical protein CUU66_20915 [Peribacillus deserti]